MFIADRCKNMGRLVKHLRFALFLALLLSFQSCERCFDECAENGYFFVRLQSATTGENLLITDPPMATPDSVVCYVVNDAGEKITVDLSLSGDMLLPEMDYSIETYYFEWLGKTDSVVVGLQYWELEKCCPSFYSIDQLTVNEKVVSGRNTYDWVAVLKR